MSGNGLAFLQSLGCSNSNPIGPLNDPDCDGINDMPVPPGIPAAGPFTPGTRYDMYNRNLALNSKSLQFAASPGIGARVTGFNPDGTIAAIDGTPP